MPLDADVHDVAQRILHAASLTQSSVPAKQIVNECFRVCPNTVGKETFSKHEHRSNKRQVTRFRHRNIVCEAIIQDHPLSDKLFSWKQLKRRRQRGHTKLWETVHTPTLSHKEPETQKSLEAHD